LAAKWLYGNLQITDEGVVLAFEGMVARAKKQTASPSSPD
jgi:hypothetical protein